MQLLACTQSWLVCPLDFLCPPGGHAQSQCLVLLLNGRLRLVLVLLGLPVPVCDITEMLIIFTKASGPNRSEEPMLEAVPGRKILGGGLLLKCQQRPSLTRLRSPCTKHGEGLGPRNGCQPSLQMHTVFSVAASGPGSSQLPQDS